MTINVSDAAWLTILAISAAILVAAAITPPF